MSQEASRDRRGPGLLRGDPVVGWRVLLMRFRADDAAAAAACYPSVGGAVMTDLKDIIQRFYRLQSERIETYQLFEEGHEAYLRTGPHYDFDHYKQLVHEITQAFCGISKEVLGIKERLHHEFDRPDLSEHLEKLQNKEKQKLELTAMLQLARQQAQDHPEEDEHQERIQEVKQKIIKIKEDLSEIMQDFKFDCEE
ncbi:hypothetical protein D4764_07G0005110 [Takifugu flavidus]|uniref:Required for excision 1-B domain-containing protein n=2 Tax=Takifugu TaxID=31032 RepID=A0A5C6MRC0_9TELE|nr:hypothetical protein D4764_07G0005110 [Takifugu flavidus]